jgi:hypothetical protein
MTLSSLQGIELATEVRNRRDSTAVEARAKERGQKDRHPHCPNDEENKLAHNFGKPSNDSGLCGCTRVGKYP